jgi:hypothetical protein
MPIEGEQLRARISRQDEIEKRCLGCVSVGRYEDQQSTCLIERDRLPMTITFTIVDRKWFERGEKESEDESMWIERTSCDYEKAIIIESRM